MLQGMFRALYLTLLLLAPAPFAAAQNLLPGFTGFGITAPPDPPPPGGSRHYGATAANTPWVVVQWNIPGGALSPFTRAADGSFTSQAAEASVHVQPGASVRMAQNGAVLPCDDAKGQPRESDLFIQPAHAQLQTLLPLASLASLHQIVDVSAAGALLPGHACRVNQGSALIAIILVDHAVQPAQSFFYQLTLSQLCRAGPGAAPCVLVQQHGFYYFRNNPYGMDDYLPLAGHGFINSSTSVHLDIDLLPRLKSAIAGAPASMDKDLSHWVLASVYCGQHIWGKVTLQTSWSGYQLIATPQP